MKIIIIFITMNSTITMKKNTNLMNTNSDDNDNDSADDDNKPDVEDCKEEDSIVSDQWNIFGLL